MVKGNMTGALRCQNEIRRGNAIRICDDRRNFEFDLSDGVLCCYELDLRLSLGIALPLDDFASSA
jgi:hypothetical protein